MSIQLFQDIKDVKALYSYLKGPINDLSNNTRFLHFQRKDFNEQIAKVVTEMQKLLVLCADRLENYADQDE